MITTLSSLVEMIEAGTIPQWLRNEIFAKRAEIAVALENGSSFTLHGPEGESVTIHAEKQTAAA
jgi:hypothetical protein